MGTWVGWGDTAPATESFGKEGQTPGGVKMRQKFRVRGTETRGMIEETGSDQRKKGPFFPSQIPSPTDPG